TVAAAVAISGFVALTLSPALCARVLRRSEAESGVKRALERGSQALENAYTGALRVSFARRGATLAVGVAWFALGLAMLFAGVVDREFIPPSDRGGFFVFTRAPEGSTIEYSDRYQRQVEQIVLAQVPELDRYFSVIALGIGAPGLVNEGIVIGSLADERARTTREIVEDLRDPLWAVTGTQAFPTEFPSRGRGFGAAPGSLVVQGPDITKLAGYADEIARRAQAEIPGLFNVRSDLLLNKPQLDVEIDRNRAADLGVSVR